jgi:quercetin 2,3-dioxygenase
MSGPVSTQDATAETEPGGEVRPPCLEVTDSRETDVGAFHVRRALPRRGRRTVGAWCFADHMGPAQVTEDRGPDIGPHPHIGLQTVTWLMAGEILHRDSLGTEQLIRPGQLNLMTAGHGVSHAEEGTGSYQGTLHGVQLWVAQPSATRDGTPAFGHHADLPQVELDGCIATVMVGDLAGATSPARHDTDHVGIDVDFPHAGSGVLPMELGYEYAIVVTSGAVSLDDTVIEPGHLAYLGTGRDECRLTVAGPARALLIGGTPFEEPVLMWWNFVARTKDEITRARHDWATGDQRFGQVDSALGRMDVGPPPWAP